MKKKIYGIIFIILGIIGTLILEKYFIDRPFSIDRELMYVYVIVFIGLHIMIDIKQIWNFIYKKRFLIGIIVFVYVILMGYNGSSMSAYNSVIEPNYLTKDMIPIIGKAREIRSDEFLGETTGLLSQYNRNKNLEKINNALMAMDTKVTMYPQLPTKDISILTNIRFLGFPFLGVEQAYSFYWYVAYFVLFFALFELFMILTKKNKLLSLAGTVMLEFSPSILWWSTPTSLLYGTLATIFFYHLFKSNKKWQKVLFSVLLGWMGACYVMMLYPAWMIPYGYLFLLLFIYSIILNKDNIKKTDFLYLIITVFVMCLLLIPNFLYSKEVFNAMMSTEYPGSRNSIGGTGWELYFNFYSSIFYSLRSIGNPCEGSQFLSLYPIPIILGVYTIIKDIKNKNKINILLTLLVSLAILLSIWNFVPIGIFSKITFLFMSTEQRSQVIVNVICIFIMIILMNEYSVDKINNNKRIIASVFAIISCSIGLYICYKNFSLYMSTIKLILSFIFFFVLSYLLLINKKSSNKLFVGIMIIFGLFLFITIHPINKGLSAMYNKPVAKEIQKINSIDKNGVWIIIDAPLHLQNYILANGARVLNSTNYYPNLKLWYKLDETKKYNEVYNRYAHIFINLIDEKTNFELIQADLFRLNINKNDICKLGAKYIATMNSGIEGKLNNIEKIYSYSNIFIYSLSC